jgi:hypothetical protein
MVKKKLDFYVTPAGVVVEVCNQSTASVKKVCPSQLRLYCQANGTAPLRGNVSGSKYNLISSTRFLGVRGITSGLVS